MNPELREIHKPSHLGKPSRISEKVKSESFRRVDPKCYHDDEPLMPIDEYDELSIKMDYDHSLNRPKKKKYDWDFS